MRLQTESQKETGLRKAIEDELAWVRSNAKGQQKKGKARLRAFDELTQQVSRESWLLIVPSTDQLKLQDPADSVPLI